MTEQTKTEKSPKEKGGKSPSSGSQDKPKIKPDQMAVTDKSDQDELFKKAKEISHLTGRSEDEAFIALHDTNGDANRAVDLIYEQKNSQEEWHKRKTKRKKTGAAPIIEEDKLWGSVEKPIAAGDAHTIQNKGHKLRETGDGNFGGKGVGRGFVNGGSNNRERNNFGGGFGNSRFESSRGSRKGFANSGRGRNFRDKDSNSTYKSNTTPTHHHNNHHHHNNIDTWSNNTAMETNKSTTDNFQEDADDWDGTLEESLVLTRSATAVSTSHNDTYASSILQHPPVNHQNPPTNHQQSSTNHQQSSTNHQHPSNNHQHPSNNQQHTSQQPQYYYTPEEQQRQQLQQMQLNSSSNTPASSNSTTAVGNAEGTFDPHHHREYRDNFLPSQSKQANHFSSHPSTHPTTHPSTHSTTTNNPPYYANHYNKEASECIKNAIGVNSGPSQQQQPQDRSKQQQQLMRAKVPPPSKIPQSAVEMPGMLPNINLDVQFGSWDYSHANAADSASVVTSVSETAAAPAAGATSQAFGLEEQLKKKQQMTFQQVLSQRSHTDTVTGSSFQQQHTPQQQLTPQQLQQQQQHRPQQQQTQQQHSQHISSQQTQQSHHQQQETHQQQNKQQVNNNESKQQQQQQMSGLKSLGLSSSATSTSSYPSFLPTSFPATQSSSTTQISSQFPPYPYNILPRTSSSTSYNHPSKPPNALPIDEKSPSLVFNNTSMYHHYTQSPPNPQLTEANPQYLPSPNLGISNQQSMPSSLPPSTSFHHHQNYKNANSSMADNNYSSEMIFHNQVDLKSSELFRNSQFRSGLDTNPPNTPLDKLVSGFNKANLKEQTQVVSTTTSTTNNHRFDTNMGASAVNTSTSSSITTSLVNKSSPNQMPANSSVQSTVTSAKSLSSYLSSNNIVSSSNSNNTTSVSVGGDGGGVNSGGSNVGGGGNSVSGGVGMLNHNYNMVNQPPGFQMTPFGYHQGNLSQYSYEDLPLQQHQTRFNQGQFYDMANFQNLTSNSLQQQHQRNEQQHSQQQISQQLAPSVNQAFANNDGKLSSGGSESTTSTSPSSNTALQQQQAVATGSQHFPAAYQPQMGYTGYYFNQNMLPYYPMVPVGGMALPMTANQGHQSTAPTSQYQQKQQYPNHPFNMGGGQSGDFNKGFTSPPTSLPKSASANNQGSNHGDLLMASGSSAFNKQHVQNFDKGTFHGATPPPSFNMTLPPSNQANYTGGPYVPTGATVMGHHPHHHHSQMLHHNMVNNQDLLLSSGRNSNAGGQGKMPLSKPYNNAYWSGNN